MQSQNQLNEEGRRIFHGNYPPIDDNTTDEVIPENRIEDENGQPVTIKPKRKPFRRTGICLGRNCLCPCGSGKKFKRCCKPSVDVLS